MEAPSLALVAVAIVLLTAPLPASATHEAEVPYPSPIQPGAMHRAGGSACTFNFVFQDTNASDTLYIGTAAHCVGGVGDRIEIPHYGEIGTVVYVGDTSPSVLGMGEGVEGHHKDFALVKVDADEHDLVDPSVRYWGGPNGVATSFTPGEPLLAYGNAKYVSATSYTRPRLAHLVTVYDDRSVSNGGDYEGWYLANGPFYSGDSGAPVLTADGQALGIISTFGVTVGEPATELGPTIETIRSDLAAAGFDVELVTAPVTTTSPEAFVAANRAEAENCRGNPLGSWTSQACLRDPDPWPARHTSAHVVADPEKHQPDSQPPDETHTRYYNVANGASVSTSMGETGATTAATDSNQPPIYIEHDASEVTIEANDLVSNEVYLSVCLDTSATDDDFTRNDLVCSQQDPDDSVTRGFSGLTLHDVPAGSWVGAAPYGIYVDDSGDVALATDGKLRYEITWG